MPPYLYHPLTVLVSAAVVLWCTPLVRTAGLKIGLLSLPVAVIWLAGMANAINWTDGLDGLAAGVSGIAALVMVFANLFVSQPAATLIAAAPAGGALAFLKYNFNPAEIFMGDGGAYFTGFTLAGVGVIGLDKTTAMTAVLLPHPILAVPILDMSAVILSRLREGKSFFIAGKGHCPAELYQQARLEAGSTVVLSADGLTKFPKSLFSQPFR